MSVPKYVCETQIRQRLRFFVHVLEWAFDRQEKNRWGESVRP